VSVKFCALATDFDGTIAEADVLDAEARRAIGELREQGIVVVLATGRILDDLQRVAGDLHFVDAVVAENGAVVTFPESGYTSVLGSAPPAALLAEPEREGISFDAGQVVVETSASEAPRVLAIVRRLELPLVLAFNRSRLMVLPQTISKATGVGRALTILRLSPHNAVAIGDAENDHELLRACEVGVAVAWGSQALKAAADYVLPGEGPRAVADYVRALANRARVPAPLGTRRHLLLGHSDDGRPLSLAVRGRNVLVAGDAKSGKSWVTGLLCEQLILYGYSLCVLDPEGDYLSLEALPGVVVLGGADPLPRPRELLRRLRHADVSVVIDLSHASQQDKTAYLRQVLPLLAEFRRQTGLPHRIVVDEAHYFLHDSPTSLLDLELNGYTLVTYRASHLTPDILAASQAVVVTRESDPHEVEALFALCQSCRGPRSVDDWKALLGRLAIGEAAILPVTDEAEGALRHIRLAPRLTPHVRHLAKYVDVPVTAAHAFVFWRNGVPTSQRVRTLRDFVAVLDREPGTSWLGHVRRGDFSRWIQDVFGDYPLAATMREIEAEATTTGADAATAAIAGAVRARYELLPQASSERRDPAS
jgi:hydroxymethylpyrimidine pyrophosphatase-like HAD family hydrolase